MDKYSPKVMRLPTVSDYYPKMELHKAGDYYLVDEADDLIHALRMEIEGLQFEVKVLENAIEWQETEVNE